MELSVSAKGIADVLTVVFAFGVLLGDLDVVVVVVVVVVSKPGSDDTRVAFPLAIVIISYLRP